MVVWRETFPLVGTSPAIIIAALDLATHHKFSIWDATILATAADASCAMLLSEDMQDGFVWSGVTIANPFATNLNPSLQTLLDTTG